MIFGEGKIDDRRPCLVAGDQAFFHSWVDQDESIITVETHLNSTEYATLCGMILRGNPLPKHCNVQIMRRHYALIEYIDGTVELVRPELVRFTDN